MKRVSFWYGSVVMIVALAAIGLVTMTGGAGSEAYAAENYNTIKSKCEPMVTLPADDAVHSDTLDHPNTLEWWYWTGHLQTKDGRWFGFETTFFSFPNVSTGAPSPAQSVDQAITDIADGSFHCTSSGVIPGQPDYVPDGFNLHIHQGDARAYAWGGDGHDVLHGEVDGGYNGGYVFDLKLDSLKPPVLQYCTGHIDYSDFFNLDAESYYYSREHMQVEGMLRDPDGVWFNVNGTAWFDHQWGNQIGLLGQDIRWNWFAIQLEDGSDIMVYVMLQGDDPEDLVLVLSHGSFTDHKGHTTDLEGDDFTITPTDTWTNDSGCVYDMGWDIVIEMPKNKHRGGQRHRACDLYNLRVDPVFENQEVVSGNYWEGVATVTGTRRTGKKGHCVPVTGRAFVEMANYCN